MCAYLLMFYSQLYMRVHAVEALKRVDLRLRVASPIATPMSNSALQGWERVTVSCCGERSSDIQPQGPWGEPRRSRETEATDRVRQRGKCMIVAVVVIVVIVVVIIIIIRSPFNVLPQRSCIDHAFETTIRQEAETRGRELRCLLSHESALVCPEGCKFRRGCLRSKLPLVEAHCSTSGQTKHTILYYDGIWRTSYCTDRFSGTQAGRFS